MSAACRAQRPAFSSRHTHSCARDGDHSSAHRCTCGHAWHNEVGTTYPDDVHSPMTRRGDCTRDDRHFDD